VHKQHIAELPGRHRRHTRGRRRTRSRWSSCSRSAATCMKRIRPNCSLYTILAAGAEGCAGSFQVMRTAALAEKRRMKDAKWGAVLTGSVCCRRRCLCSACNHCPEAPSDKGLLDMQPTHCSSWQQKRAKMRSKLSTWSTIYGVISVPSTTARRGVSDVMGAAAVACECET
jgi:hypothetical protein